METDTLLLCSTTILRLLLVSAVSSRHRTSEARSGNMPYINARGAGDMTSAPLTGLSLPCGPGTVC